MLGNSLQAGEAINFVMRTQPQMRVRVVYRRSRLVLFGPAAAEYQRAKRDIDHSPTSQARIRAMSDFVDKLLASCSPADASLQHYMRDFMLQVKQDPDCVFSLKYIILYHWSPGAPLEFHQHSAYNKQTFDDRPGWIVLDARNNVSARLADPQPSPAGCASSFPTMGFSRYALFEPLHRLHMPYCGVRLCAARLARWTTRSDTGRLCQA